MISSPHENHDAFLAKLVQAILSYVKQRDGYVTKTKLLKYLYLIDIEHCRLTGSLLTGFRWKFYKYGPWTAEYDTLYTRLQQQDAIIVKPGNRPELDTEFISCEDEVELEEVFKDFKEEVKVRRILELWASRPLGEMLDYVYFHTEPMAEAKRDEFLDFGKVGRSVVEPPKKAAIAPEQKRPPIAKLRERFKQAFASRQAAQSRPMTPPRYDEVFRQGVMTLDNDTEY